MTEIERLEEKYKITEEEFEIIYKKFEELTFCNVKPAKGRPIAIFTGGQPGAGKTALLLRTKSKFEKLKKDVLLFDLDSYRNYSKNCEEIAINYPEHYSYVTGKIAGKIMERLSKKAIIEGYNFILEGTMGKSIYTLDMLQEMQADYNVIVKLIAVSQEESLLSIFERYINMKKLKESVDILQLKVMIVNTKTLQML